MKSTIKNGILTLTMLSLSIMNTMADSSKVTNSILVVEEMHQQEVVLQVRLDNLTTIGSCYIIRKSTDGIHYTTLTETEVPLSEVSTLVFADHVSADAITYYQLIASTIYGEEVIATKVFDPELPLIGPTLKVSTQDGEMIDSEALMLDPHSI